MWWSVSAKFPGNVWITGSFRSPAIIFDSITLSNAGPSYSDMFVVKYDALGTVQWAKRAGGTSNDGGAGIFVSANGDVFVTGEFQGSSITFGSTILTNVNSGFSDFFVVKYDASGNPIWAKSAGGQSHDYGKSISIDGNGNVIVTGSFVSYSIIFGSTTLTIASMGYYDFFIVKYDAAGNVLWAKSEGGNYDDRTSDLVVDSNGNMFLTGSFRSDSLNFGVIILTNSNSSNADVFVAKYDIAGNLLWAKKGGGSGNDAGSNVLYDIGGCVLIAGSFSSDTIIFDSTVLINFGGGGFYDIFIVKYDASGNLLWSKAAGGSNFDYGSGISIDPSGSILLTGSFKSTSITFGSDTLINGGNYDFLVAKLDSLDGTGVSEINDNSGFIIYPNPSNGDFTFCLGKKINEGTIEFINTLGKTVYINNGTFKLCNRISLNNLSSGIYLIRFFDGKTFCSKKIIIK